VEEEIYQVKNKSGQDPLNYPVKLNNQLAALQHIIETGDGRPTAQSYQVFGELVTRLEELNRRLEGILTTDLGSLDALLVNAKLEPIQRN
jgi:hypothetical protein